MMRTRTLGTSDLSITPMGFGSWAIGGADWVFGWGPQDDADSIATIREAIDLGINWIDTAAVYGLGHSEEVVAKALEGVANRPYVFTKCERVWDEQGKVGGRLKADSIRKECEASLRRLKVDVIDLYQVHWPQPDEDIEEGWTAMAELQRQGKARWIGVSNFDVGQMRRAQAIAPIASLQPPYSLLNRSIEDEILPFCAENQIGVIVYSPMASGLLTGTMTADRVANLPANDWRRNHKNYQEPLLTRNLGLAEVVKRIAGKHGCAAGEVAIAWTLRNAAVTGAIVGARRPGQLKELTGGATLRLDPEDLADLEAFLEAHPG